jgi:CRISPR-associated protein Csd1
MSILASLVRAYDRMGDSVPAYGFSTEKIGFLVSLSDNGTPAGAPIDLREREGKKKTPRAMAAPQPAKRTSGVSPNFLWDKTSYALGVTAGEGRRTKEEHAKFREFQEGLLKDSEDPGLRAFLLFLRTWTPEDFERLGWPEEMKDQNIVFTLESDRKNNVRIHDRPAARDIWAAKSAGGDRIAAACLVTGAKAPVARLHPAIKGVWGAQSSGASLVSFNLDAFTSYGHEQGENAPVSEAAVFAYTTALNRFLQTGSANRIQIGDASTVFWADATNVETAKEAEGLFASFMNIDEGSEAKKVRAILENVRMGRAPADFTPDLPDKVRFHVLGLAPNAARLSVRFYIEDDFGRIAANFLAHVERLRIEPPPRAENPALWKYLAETAARGKSENVPPNLAGEFLRAILTGMPYPRNLLAVLLMRLRTDKDVNALRVSLLKAILLRNHSHPRTDSPMEVSVSLNPQNNDPGYLLGRLFASY